MSIYKIDDKAVGLRNELRGQRRARVFRAVRDFFGGQRRRLGSSARILRETLAKGQIETSRPSSLLAHRKAAGNE